MINLKIDPEFQSQIPPLTDDEFKQLEENILKEGKLLSPLIVWNNTLVDGHNRYEIVQEHPEIYFSTMPLRFENREEAIAWICRNQLGRRNLSPEQKRYWCTVICAASIPPESWSLRAARLSTSSGVFKEKRCRSILRLPGSGVAKQRMRSRTCSTSLYNGLLSWKKRNMRKCSSTAQRSRAWRTGIPLSGKQVSKRTLPS